MKTLSRRSTLIVWTYGLSLILVNLGRAWALTYHEAIFAEGAREFLRDGGWLIPRFLGKPLFEYPPLTQWLIAASMAVTGSEAEWVARLPIGLATVLGAWFIAKLAARWHGDRVGVVSALIQLTTFYGLMQSRLAESDMIVSATVTMAMTCLALARVGVADGAASCRWLMLGYFGSTALSFLAKGPIGPAFIAMGSLAFALLDRRRATWRFLVDPIGWALLLAVTLGWLAAMTRSDPRMPAMMRENILDRFTTGKAMDTDGREGPLYYLWIVPLLLFPWTPWVIAGAWRGRSGADRPAGSWTFLGCWFGAGLVLLSCSAFKHKHYVIPLLPPLSIVAAVGLLRQVEGRRPSRRAVASAGMVAALLAGSVAVGVAWSGRGPAWLPWLAPMLAIAGAGATASLWLRSRGEAGRSLVAVFGASWLMVLIVRSAVLPTMDDYRNEAALARRVNAKVSSGASIYLVHARFAQMGYYLRPLVIRQDRLADFSALMARKADGDVTYAVAPEADIAGLSALGEVTVLEKSPMHKKLTVVSIRARGSVAASKVEPPR